MNPLELVAKTLYNFQEKELTIQLLLAFGKRAENFQQYNDVAKIFFEIKDFTNAIVYGEKALKLATAKDEKYITTKNLINAYNQNNYPEKSITQISKNIFATSLYCWKFSALFPKASRSCIVSSFSWKLYRVFATNSSGFIKS